MNKSIYLLRIFGLISWLIIFSFSSSALAYHVAIDSEKGIDDSASIFWKNGNKQKVAIYWSALTLPTGISVEGVDGKIQIQPEELDSFVYKGNTYLSVCFPEPVNGIGGCYFMEEQVKGKFQLVKGRHFWDGCGCSGEGREVRKGYVLAKNGRAIMLMDTSLLGRLKERERINRLLKAVKVDVMEEVRTIKDLKQAL